MKFFLYILLVILVAIGAAYLYALQIPVRQTHTRSITLQQPPDAIFAALADFQNMPKWNSNMEKIEMLPPIDGKEATRQTFKGNMQMTIVTSESSPPTHLVRSMIDDGRTPFTGSWTYEITPVANGSSVALTEVSEVKNPFFRLMMKLFGQTKYMDEHLRDLAKKFGETVTVR